MLEEKVRERTRELAETQREILHRLALAGEEIPLEVRLVAICDVFDALLSVRPYKPAWPLNDAVAYLPEQSGEHLDPWLTGVFLELLPEILTIRARFAD